MILVPSQHIGCQICLLFHELSRKLWSFVDFEYGYFLHVDQFPFSQIFQYVRIRMRARALNYLKLFLALVIDRGHLALVSRANHSHR